MAFGQDPVQPPQQKTTTQEKPAPKPGTAEWNAANQQRLAAERKANPYGLAPRSGYVVSSYSRPQGGQAAKAEARALETQRAQDEARNKQIMLTLKRQRKSSKRLMKKARRATKRSGKAARADIKRQGIKTAGAGEAALVSRGLGSTTVRANFQRGVDADVQRNLTLQKDLQAQRLAGLFSQEAGMQGQTAQLGLQGINMQSGGLADYIKLLMMMNGGLS
jgi:hypothetical protein